MNEMRSALTSEDGPSARSLLMSRTLMYYTAEQLSPH